jgi:hypothetical protein
MFLSCSCSSDILILTISDSYLTVLDFYFKETFYCEIFYRASITHSVVIVWDVHMVDLNWDMIGTKSVHQ